MGTKHKWVVTINGEQHMVILRHDPGGELWLDGKIIRSWQGQEPVNSMTFSLGKRDVILREFGYVWWRYVHTEFKLFVEGDEIPEADTKS